MTIKGHIEANLSDGILVLRYEDAGVPVTEYRYEAGIVAMSGLDGPVEVPLANLRNTVRDLNHYITMIRMIVERGRNQLHTDEYEINEKRKPDTIESVYRYGAMNATMLDMEYDFTTGIAKFKSRSAITVPWEVFAHWASRITAVLQMVDRGGVYVP